MIIIAVHLLSDCKCTGYLFNSKANPKNEVKKKKAQQELLGFIGKWAG
jgi:hypothetical protein